MYGETVIFHLEINIVLQVYLGICNKLMHVRFHYQTPAHLDVVIEEVRLKVIYTELKSTQTLVDESLGAIQG